MVPVASVQILIPSVLKPYLIMNEVQDKTTVIQDYTLGFSSFIVVTLQFTCEKIVLSMNKSHHLSMLHNDGRTLTVPPNNIALEVILAQDTF